MNRYVKNSIKDTTPLSLKAINENMDYLYQNIDSLNPKKRITSIDISTEDKPVVAYDDNSIIHLSAIRDTEGKNIKKVVDVNTLEEIDFNMGRGVKIVPVLELEADLYAALHSGYSLSGVFVIGCADGSTTNATLFYNGVVSLIIKLEMLNGKYYCNYRWDRVVQFEYFPIKTTPNAILIKGLYYIEIIPKNDKLIFLEIYSSKRVAGDNAGTTINVINNTDRIFYYHVLNDDDKPRLSTATCTGKVHQGKPISKSPTDYELLSAINYFIDTEVGCNCSTTWHIPLIDYGNVAIFEYTGSAILKIKIPVTIDGYQYYYPQKDYTLKNGNYSDCVHKLYKNNLYYNTNSYLMKYSFATGRDTIVSYTLGKIYDFSIYNNKVFALVKKDNVYQIIIYDLTQKSLSSYFCPKVVSFALNNGFIYAMKDDDSGNRLLYRYSQDGSGETLIKTIGPSISTGNEMAIVLDCLYFCRFTRWEYDNYNPMHRYDTLYKLNLDSGNETQINSSPNLTMSRGIIILDNHYYYDCSSITGINGTKSFPSAMNLDTGIDENDSNSLLYGNLYNAYPMYNVIPCFGRAYFVDIVRSVNNPTDFIEIESRYSDM